MSSKNLFSFFIMSIPSDPNTTTTFPHTLRESGHIKHKTPKNLIYEDTKR